MKERITPANQYTNQYFIYNQRSQSFYDQVLNWLPKNINGPFLDIGCGRGELVIALGRFGKEAYGIDYSKAAIDLCRRSLNKQLTVVKSLIHFQKADCTILPFAGQTFNGIFLLDIVEHLTPKQLKDTLAEISRVIKPNGIVIIHTNNKYYEKATKLILAAYYHGLGVFLKPKIYLNQMANPYDNLHINYLAGNEIDNLLKKLGFKSRIEYVKPDSRKEIEGYLPHTNSWRRFLFTNLAWVFINSPLIKFLSPTYWVIGVKVQS